MSKVKYREFLIPCGDWNGHTGQLVEGFQGFHGGLAYGEKKIKSVKGYLNLDILLILLFQIHCNTNKIHFNTKSHLVTFHFSSNQSQLSNKLLVDSF